MRRVGKQSRFVVIEIDRGRNRLIMSERAALDGKSQDQVLARLTAGDVVTGRVSNLRRFGAFVDLGGFEGLIHISEMSWGRVNYPGDVIHPGDEVRVYVLTSTRRTQSTAQPQALAVRPMARHRRPLCVGEVVKGEVTNVVSFGAFVRLDEGIEGLIHISELAEGNFLHPRNVVCEGQRVEAQRAEYRPRQPAASA